MAYATTNPPKLLVPSLAGGQPALWVYASADVHTDVDAAGYFADGDARGMKVGDIVMVQETDNSYVTTIHAVSAVTAGGAATVNSAVLA